MCSCQEALTEKRKQAGKKTLVNQTKKLLVFSEQSHPRVQTSTSLNVFGGVEQYPYRFLCKTESKSPKRLKAVIKRKQMVHKEVRILEIQEENADKEKAKNIKVISALRHFLRRSQAELLEIMEERQTAAKIQAKGFTKELKQETAELKGRKTKLEQLLLTEDRLHLLQLFPSTTLSTLLHNSVWTKISINTDQSTECEDSFSTLKAIEKMPEISKDYRQLSEGERKNKQSAMASSSTLLSEEQFQCSICLDVFTDPVSTPCGHNFCMACLSKCWNNSRNCQCPFCKEKFPRRPELRVNTFISGMVLQFRESLQAKSRSCSKEPPAELEYVPCDFCTDPKGNAVKSCLDCGMSFCDMHLEHHKIAAKLKKHKLINAVKNLEDYICQKHDRAVELYCRDDQKCVCLFCTESDHKTHNTVPIEEESGQRKAQMRETQAHIQKMIQDRMKKIEEIRHAAELKKKNADKEKADSIQVFTALISTIGRIQAELLEMMEKRQKATEIQAEGLIKELEKEITELKGRDTELEKLLHTEDHLHLLHICPSITLSTLPNTSNWTEIKINTDWSTEGRRKALFQLQQLVSEEIEKMSEIIVPDLDTQRAEIAALLKTRLLEGDTWYLVGSCWFKEWKKYVGFDSWDKFSVGKNDAYPGPVDNSGLLQDTNSHSIKDHLIDELDYILLPTEAWYKLISWYGLAEGQKPIARKVIVQGMFVKHLKVEVYLTELKLCKCGDMDNIIKRSFSKADTVASIEKEMRSLFGIPDEKVCRLWNKYMSNTFEPLNKPEFTFLEAGLFQGQVLVIEQKNEDGTWPGVEQPHLLEQT